MRSPLLIGNWKLHGTRDSIDDLLCGLQKGLQTVHRTVFPQVVVLPPAIFISQVAKTLQKSPIAWGAQDMSMHQKGAYTGEISGVMLREFGCRYVLLGHSERRQYFAETDIQVAKKLSVAIGLGLTPILCVGETWEQYQSGQTETTLLEQLNHYLVLGTDTLRRAVIAYEPVWAVGTGRSATPEVVQEVHKRLRQKIAVHLGAELAYQVRILYGGSVSSDNARALFAMPDIDGGLLGNASLSSDTFLNIYHSFP